MKEGLRASRSCAPFLIVLIGARVARIDDYRAARNLKALYRSHCFHRSHFTRNFAVLEVWCLQKAYTTAAPFIPTLGVLRLPTKGPVPTSDPHRLLATRRHALISHSRPRCIPKVLRRASGTAQRQQLTMKNLSQLEKPTSSFIKRHDCKTSITECMCEEQAHKQRCHVTPRCSRPAQNSQEPHTQTRTKDQQTQIPKLARPSDEVSRWRSGATKRGQDQVDITMALHEKSARERATWDTRHGSPF